MQAYIQLNRNKNQAKAISITNDLLLKAFHISVEAIVVEEARISLMLELSIPIPTNPLQAELSIKMAKSIGLCVAKIASGQGVILHDIFAT